MAKEEAIERIWEAVRSRRTELILSNLNLSDKDLNDLLPIIEKELPELTKLDLSHNNITGNKSELTRLSPLNNLKNLKNLKHLLLVNNEKLYLTFENLDFIKNIEILEYDMSQLLPVLTIEQAKYLDLDDNEYINVTGIEPDRIVPLQTALKSINVAATNQSWESWDSEDQLNLSGLGLTNADLDKLLPFIQKRLPNLTFLELSQNKLTRVPKLNAFNNLTDLTLHSNEITGFTDELDHLEKLKSLTLENNRLTNLPENIKNLKELTYVDFSYNQLIDIPIEIGTLGKIKTLFLDNNQIVVLPESVGGLGHLDLFALQNNPLSPETMQWLTRQVPTAIFDMAAHSTVSTEDYKMLIDRLYGSERLNVLEKINTLTNENFIIIGTNQSTSISGKEVIQNFLNQAAPHNKGASRTIYDTVIKHCLDQVNTGNATEKENIIGELSTTLGNCATPVNDYIINKAIALNTQYPEIFSDTEEFNALIERAALQRKLQIKFDLNKNEGIEKLQGLLNSIYFENAENISTNQIKISGDRKRLPSISAYPVFAFNLVTPEYIGPFVQLCCKTDEKNLPIKDNGHYILDQEKLDIIKKEFLYDIQPDREIEALVKNCRENCESLLGDIAYMTIPPEVQEKVCLNEEHLKKELLACSDTKLRDEKVKEFIENISKNIKEFKKTPPPIRPPRPTPEELRTPPIRPPRPTPEQLRQLTQPTNLRNDVSNKPRDRDNIVSLNNVKTPPPRPRGL